MNTELGRKVLDHVTAHRDQFDMRKWGEGNEACGTTACLAGWAMLLSGYSLRDWDIFVRPDGSFVPRGYRNDEGAALLELSEAERYGDVGQHTLFGEPDDDKAIERFRALLEAAEAGQRDAGTAAPAAETE